MLLTIFNKRNRLKYTVIYCLMKLLSCDKGKNIQFKINILNSRLDTVFTSFGLFSSFYWNVVLYMAMTTVRMMYIVTLPHLKNIGRLGSLNFKTILNLLKFGSTFLSFFLELASYWHTFKNHCRILFKKRLFLSLLHLLIVIIKPKVRI